MKEVVNMSRSYKKTPIVKDHTRGMKACANRKVRRMKDVPQFGGYKKCFCSYDICDWWFGTTFDEYFRGEQRCEHEAIVFNEPWRGYKGGPRSKAEIYNEWAKIYIRK